MVTFMPFIRCASHRARQRAVGLIQRQPQGGYAWSRPSKGGIYEVTAEEQAVMLAAGIPGVTVPRKTDDLLRCW